ncbi:MAG: hypothetical protein ABIP39_08245, partial [Polyangiaceae bacterium]
MSLSRFLPCFTLVAIAACIPVHDKVIADGTDGNLEFGGDLDSKMPFAVDVPFEATISRYDAQWNTCVIMKSEGTNVRPQGCSSDPEPIDWVSGACEDPSLCSVELASGQGGGKLTVHVTGLAEGTTRVRVNVKSAHDSASWSDAFPVTFRKATALKLDGPSTKYAFFPGKSLRWCPSLQNVTGDVSTSLFTPSSAVTTALDGTSVTTAMRDYDTSCNPVDAVSVGTTSITVHAGPIVRTFSVRVADPNAVTAMELRTVTKRDPAADVDEDPLLDSATPKSFQLDVASNEQLELTSVVTLADGTLALGGAGRVTVSPADLAHVHGNAEPPIAQTTVSVASAIRTGLGKLE